MKKLLLSILCIISVSLNAFRLPWSTQPEPKIATIFVTDPIENTAPEIFDALKNPNIAGVILVINSGGGDAGLCSVVHDMVKKLHHIKPVVSLITGSALSGGYLVASAADTVLAHSASNIGSIGAALIIERYKNIHVKHNDMKADCLVDGFFAGEFKGIFNTASAELTPQQREYLQASVLKSYEIFLTLVAKNRSLKKENYKTWAEGKVFLSPEALKLGLIDGIGTIVDAEELIKKLIARRKQK